MAAANEAPPVASAVSKSPAKKKAKRETTERTLAARQHSESRLYIGHLHAKDFVKWLSYIGVFAKIDVTLDFTARGLRVAQENSSRTFAGILHVPVEAFASYNITGDPPSASYRVSYEHVKKFQKACLDEQTLVFEDTGKDRLHGRLHSTKRSATFAFPLKTIDEGDEALEYPVDEWRYPFTVELPTRDFYDLVANADSGEQSLIEFGIGLTEDKARRTLTFRSIADTSIALTDGNWESSYVPDKDILIAMTDDGNEPENHFRAYSTIFLRVIANLKDIAPSMTMRFGSADYPLYCSFELPRHDDCRAAPRVTVLLFGREQE